MASGEEGKTKGTDGVKRDGCAGKEDRRRGRERLLGKVGGEGTFMQESNKRRKRKGGWAVRVSGKRAQGQKLSSF